MGKWILFCEYSLFSLYNKRKDRLAVFYNQTPTWHEPCGVLLVTYHWPLFQVRPSYWGISPNFLPPIFVSSKSRLKHWDGLAKHNRQGWASETVRHMEDAGTKPTCCVIPFIRNFFKKKKAKLPWLGGSVGWSVILYTKRLWVRSLVRAHT